MAKEREPVRFWAKRPGVPAEPPIQPTSTALEALLQSLPASDLTPEVRFRSCVGMGSLGKPRFVALAEWKGGWVARKAKAVTPPATAWMNERAGDASFAAKRAARGVRLS